jgi:thiol-disulfide isomerase/thioredoxin
VSRRARNRVACFLAIANGLLGLSGCNRATTEQQSLSKTTVLASENSAEKSEPLDRVEPGTLLEEAEFKKTLLAAGAELVVVQVYLDACGPCITEALKLTQLQKPWRSRGIAILGLGMDETSAGPKSFFDNTGGRINFPLYLAPWFAKQQQIETTPVLFIYSASGEQLHRSDPFNVEINAVDEISEKLSELLAKQ